MPTASTSPPLPPTGEAAGTRLLTELRAEIARADSKAATLVAALGLIAGILGGLLTGGSWSPKQLSGVGAALLLTGGAALAASLLALLLAVLPRYGRSTWAPGRPLGYFGDIRRAAELGVLAEALVDTESAAAEGLVTALTDTSAIAARKHRWVRVGVFAFGLGTLLMPVALLLG